MTKLKRVERPSSLRLKDRDAETARAFEITGSKEAQRRRQRFRRLSDWAEGRS